MPSMGRMLYWPIGNLCHLVVGPTNAHWRSVFYRIKQMLPLVNHLTIRYVIPSPIYPFGLYGIAGPAHFRYKLQAHAVWQSPQLSQTRRQMQSSMLQEESNGM